jgi:hypothetical protein
MQRVQRRCSPHQEHRVPDARVLCLSDTAAPKEHPQTVTTGASEEHDATATIIRLLDEWCLDERRAADDSFSRVQRSLDDAPQDWVTGVSAIGHLDQDRAWILLGWIEMAASRIVRARSSELLVTGAFAMSLVALGPLDWRDCSVVASLLRRAAHLSGLDYATSVEMGCVRATPLDGEGREVLVHASARTPSTHHESGAGRTFSFVRPEPDFDVEDLARWLRGDRE